MLSDSIVRNFEDKCMRVAPSLIFYLAQTCTASPQVCNMVKLYGSVWRLDAAAPLFSQFHQHLEAPCWLASWHARCIKFPSQHASHSHILCVGMDRAAQ